jgi:hypothetical protein
MRYANSMSVDLTATQGRWIKCEAEANDADLEMWAAERELDLRPATYFQRFILMRCMVERCLLTDLIARKAMPAEVCEAELAKNGELAEKVKKAVAAKALAAA